MKTESVDLILKETCSNSLREAVKKDFALRELDILILAHKYAPDYNKRLELLNVVEKQAEDAAIRAWAARLTKFEKRKMEIFTSFRLNTVYEVKIKETPDAAEESYLAKTYLGALKKIDYFFEYYKVEQNENSRFEIARRKAEDTFLADKFEDDWLGSCVLKKGKILTEVSILEICSENTEGSQCDKEIECSECDTPCIHVQVLNLPRFLENLDLVSYTDKYTFEKKYVVVFPEFGDEDDDCAYCVSLDDVTPDTSNEDEFWNFFNAHKHIEYPRIEKVSIVDVPEEIRQAYNQFVSLYKLFYKSETAE